MVQIEVRAFAGTRLPEGATEMGPIAGCECMRGSLGFVCLTYGPRGEETNYLYLLVYLYSGIYIVISVASP